LTHRSIKSLSICDIVLLQMELEKSIA